MTDFSPITTVTVTVTHDDGTTVSATVADRPTTGVFWRVAAVTDREDMNRLLDFLDAQKVILGAYNANGGELHDVINLP